MSDRRQTLGRWGEERAIRYLEGCGCQVVALNWRCQAGEVDLVALDGDCLAFVEVRTRRGEAYGTAEESVTPRKVERMAAVAESYVYDAGWSGGWRLDVVAIQVDGKGSVSIEWYKNVSL